MDHSTCQLTWELDVGQAGLGCCTCQQELGLGVQWAEPWCKPAGECHDWGGLSQFGPQNLLEGQEPGLGVRLERELGVLSGLLLSPLGMSTWSGGRPGCDKLLHLLACRRARMSVANLARLQHLLTVDRTGCESCQAEQQYHWPVQDPGWGNPRQRN